MKNSPLGRGLQNLISEDSANPSYIPNLPIEDIVANPYQPRMHIDEEKLNELAMSIKEAGIIEPLIVSLPKFKDKKKFFELIAGERRWRAAKIAGLETVPVVIRDTSPQQMLELAIAENVQRADLNPIEEAHAFKQLVDKFHLHPYEIGEKVGYSESVVRNKIRLLGLPKQIIEGLLNDALSEGHARALLGLTTEPTMVIAYNKVVTQHLSVRATEELVRRLNLGVKNLQRPKSLILDKTTIKYEQGLKDYFGNKVNIRLTRSMKGGRIDIRYHNDEELEQVLLKIGII